MGAVEDARRAFFEIVSKEALLEEDVLVSARPLDPEEAIGNPAREDLPISLGKERIIEATFKGMRAHCFTDSPRDFSGGLGDILSFRLESNGERAIFFAALNACLKYLGLIKGTIHCKDDEPESCGREIAREIWRRFGKRRIGLVGLNPAILEALVERFGKENVRVTDLNRDVIGTERYGVEVWDGEGMLERLVLEVDLLLITGTTLVNGTFDRLHEKVRRAGKDYLLYGVTASGASWLLSLPRICPYGRE
jgi:hypothetical protein